MDEVRIVLARAVDLAAHDGDLDGLADALQLGLDEVSEAADVHVGATARWAGDEHGPLLAEVERLEDLIADVDLFFGVAAEGDTDGVADALVQDDPQPHAGADR